MKKKIVSAKLSLKKKVISPLSIERSSQIMGGSHIPTCNGGATCIVTGCTVANPSTKCQTALNCNTLPPDQIC